MLGMDIGGYLNRLEKEYNIIIRNRPFGAKEGHRSNRYKIEDNFLNFWFRFTYKYLSAVEIGNLDYVRKLNGTMKHTAELYWKNIFVRF